MIDRKSARLTTALTVLATGINAVYVFALKPMPPLATAAMIAGPALVTVFIWLIIRLVVRLSYSRAEPLDPAYAAFFGRCLAVFAGMMTVIFGYAFLLAPLTGWNLMAADTYNRMVMVVSGLVLAGLGNIVPKLPYQPLCRWLEIGPERTYRINRIGGWLMVVVGAAEIAYGLVFPLSNTQLFAGVLGGLAVLIVFNIWLYAGHLRAYRRESGVA